MEDLIAYKEKKKKYTIITNTMTFLSLVNVVIVGITWRKFLTIPTWQKIAVGSGVFFATHYLGTLSIKNEVEEMNDELIKKYGYVLNNMKFENSRLP